KHGPSRWSGPKHVCRGNRWIRAQMGYPRWRPNHNRGRRGPTAIAAGRFRTFRTATGPGPSQPSPVARALARAADANAISWPSAAAGERILTALAASRDPASYAGLLVRCNRRGEGIVDIPDARSWSMTPDAVANATAVSAPRAPGARQLRT